jgi:hypothetical protein
MKIEVFSMLQEFFLQNMGLLRRCSWFGKLLKVKRLNYKWVEVYILTK